MVKKSKKSSKRKAAKKVTRKVNEVRSSVRALVHELIAATKNAKGYTVKDLEPYMNPVGASVSSASSGRESFEKAIPRWHKYVNELLSKLHGAGFPHSRIMEISDASERTLRAFRSVLPLLKECEDEMGNASHKLADLLQLGPNQPG